MKSMTHSVRVSPELIANGLKTWRRARHLHVTSKLPEDAVLIGVEVNPPPMGAEGHEIGDVVLMFHSPGVDELEIPRLTTPMVHDLGAQRQEVVCLCGSTRFVETFNAQRVLLTRMGIIVLSIEPVTTQARSEDPQHVDPELKERLDVLHLRKIDLADRVFVLNVGGYVDESTAREIAYAEKTGKRVEYFEFHEGDVTRGSGDVDSVARLNEARAEGARKAGGDGSDA